MMNLVNARKALKKTQQEMADYLGISRQAYSNYETGKREPDYETLLKLGEYLDCSIDYLLGKRSDPLEDADIAFYDRFRSLSEEEKEDMRDYLALMEARRERRKKGQ